MKTRLPSIIDMVQRALQLELFGEVHSPERRVAPPQLPKLPAQAVTPPATGSRQRRILLENTWVEYELLRSKRRSIGFLIHAQGLRVTAPRWVTIADIELALNEKQSWIVRKLGERRERSARKPSAALPWQDGTRLPYLGDELSLRLLPGPARSSNREQDTLLLYCADTSSQAQIKTALETWLRQRAHAYFTERLPGFAEQLGVQYQSMQLSSARTRWGSCTSQGKIRLNWRLIHFSPHIIDYVIVHELAHLREMNHSPRFWATVESVFPDYHSARQQLRQHAAADLPEF
ncbi:MULTISPECIES: SprT family zinc-dependent metalloprotease [unclassified Undibacterium]|uniref:M48 family metallopeptidase n=1 Tax=unclassified Undibacterium TaxID=2630295 RepID=UPI002AC918B8|nr:MULTISPECIES: SprT family zinc-dependent metalloprotease [unclassified Undibacterium]MEB0139269.1 SprT family zinc-dependent metalloprotease [Undibacterium sp. CCC2.1]MEB0172113.1 SprT family zinc-dependent metalloprotease [Undibacterium sp. CCC1.1]MEB0175988.1 SprT family zinc-dependent metalloprotease [Undibacterium sp. CCC3.4]MEB0215300.1 SprT family zinc-dependent metalloprotease [Undibacterium sp. 5I2]WPX45474.1 SprT family zinc-dependent metalloprotease [Undibacterium sp. CCC3.4]